jgi:hypothetical protein
VEAIARTIEELPDLPNDSGFSSASILVGLWLPGRQRNLAGLLHRLWTSTVPSGIKASTTRRLADAFAVPLDSTVPNHHITQQVLELWYLLACSAADGGVRHPEHREDAITCMTERLATMRETWKTTALGHETLNPYFSVVVVLLYLVRDRDEVPVALTAELAAVPATIDLMQDLILAEHRCFREMLHQLADALARVSRSPVARDLRTCASTLTSGPMAADIHEQRLPRGPFTIDAIDKAEQWWLDSER